MAQLKTLFVGQFPGPVTGQTVMTQHIFEHLQAAAPGAVLKCNIVRGDTGSRWGNMAVKGARALKAAVQLVTRSRGRQVYISVDGNLGMAATLLYASSARLGGAARIILHHHSRNHVDHKRPLMTALAAVSGAQAVHVCICPSMSANLAAQYPGVRRSAALSNVFSLGDQPPVDHSQTPAHPARLRLGHMSKLGYAKGLRQAIASLEALLDAGIPAELTLAGPFASAQEEQFAQDAVARLGDAIRLEGPIYGAAKDQWFQSLDLFLFPSLYRNETQGIVNLEALAAGVPVIAFDGHCIADDLAGLEGWCLSKDADFAPHVVETVQRILNQADGLTPERARARKRFDSLVHAAQAELENLQTLCLGDSAP